MPVLLEYHWYTKGVFSFYTPLGTRVLLVSTEYQVHVYSSTMVCQCRLLQGRGSFVLKNSFSSSSSSSNNNNNNNHHNHNHSRMLPQQLPQPVNRMNAPGEADAVRQRLYNSGYREGGKSVKESALQEGFDAGFSEGAPLGFRVGRLFGLANVRAVAARGQAVSGSPKTRPTGSSVWRGVAVACSSS